jgi:N-acetylmuramoyl-L-alanine amidase
MNIVSRHSRLWGINLLLCFAAVASGELTITFPPAETAYTVSTVNQEGVLWAAAPQFFERLGFSWQWDNAAQQLSCTKNNLRYVFSRDVPWYSSNEELCRLSAPPQRIGAEFYVSVPALLEITKTCCGVNITWDSVKQVLSVSRQLFTITSVSVDKRDRGVLLTVALTAQVPFDYTYAHPRVTFEFERATIDTGSVKILRSTGLVDSITSYQAEESAGITVALSQEIDEPRIDYLDDRKVVLITLNPKTVKPLPAKRLNEAVSTAIRTIVIDPGHGGKDPGAIGPGGAREKEIVLAIALHLRDLLKQQREIKVFLTREKDIFIPLAERTRMANKWNADLFVSIHANATGGSKKKKETTYGYKVYFLSQAKNEEDKLAAMRENAVIELEEKPQNYSALQNVLIDLAGNEYLRESQELSIFLDQKFESALSRKISRQAKGIGQANFWVLNGAYMPSILIETGYISNRAEEKLLQSRQFQKQMAKAIFEALLLFKKKYETEQ